MSSQFSLSDFRSKVLGEGLARPNRFELLINPPQGMDPEGAKLVSLFCESVAFPNKVILSKKQKIFGPGEQRPYGVDYGGEGITATFHVDRRMQVKRFFDAWTSKVVSEDGFYAQYRELYVGTVEIRQLDEKNNITYACRLENAFPRSMGLMELNNNTNSTTHRLNVTLAYDRWIEL